LLRQCTTGRTIIPFLIDIFKSKVVFENVTKKSEPSFSSTRCRYAHFKIILLLHPISASRGIHFQNQANTVLKLKI